MNEADTSASSAIAPCTPLTVVPRSSTTFAIDTFISDVSTTSTNIAIASSTARCRPPAGQPGSPLGVGDESVISRTRARLAGVHGRRVDFAGCAREREHDLAGRPTTGSADVARHSAADLHDDVLRAVGGRVRSTLLSELLLESLVDALARDLDR